MYSKDFIQKAIDVWQPEADKMGIQLTNQDAIEIGENMANLFTLLNELYEKYES